MRAPAPVVTLRLVFDHQTIGEPDHALHTLGQHQIVGHQYDGRSGFTVQFFEERDNRGAGRAIEIPGGLVGEQNPRLIHEGPRNCHALLLSAGELGGEVVQAVAQSHAPQQLAGTLRCARDSTQFQRHLYILDSRERGNELKRLEDEAHLRATKLGSLVLTHGREFRPVEEHLTPRRGIQSGEQA